MFIVGIPLVEGLHYLFIMIILNHFVEFKFGAQMP